MRRAIGAALGALGMLVAMLSMACGPSLDPPSLVERTRVVAARVRVASDPAIAQPAPGDAITIEWIVIAPGEPEEIAATLVACAPLPGSTGMPACAPGTIAPLAPRAPSTDPLRTELVVPDAAALGGASSLLVSGAVCVGGGAPSVPSGEAMLPQCEGGPEGERAELLVLEIPLALDPEVPANRNPSLADEAWTFEGEAWEPAPDDAPLEGCGEIAGTAALPRVSADERAERVIGIGASEDDRESYVSLEGDPPAAVERREVLQVSHFATAGALERTLSAVEDSTTSDPPIEIDWSPPEVEDVAEGGTLVRFTTVFRDRRGGVDAAQRAVCVVP